MCAVLLLLLMKCVYIYIRLNKAIDIFARLLKDELAEVRIRRIINQFDYCIHLSIV